MKNNFKIFLFGAFALIAVIIMSCTNEKETFATSNGVSLSIVGNPADAPTVLTNATLANAFATFLWTRTDNGTPSESSYILEISDRDIPESSRVYIAFDNTISGVSPNLRTLTLSVDDMNKLMNDLPSFKCSPMNIDVRIKSILGNTDGSKFIQYSNNISYVVTGYSKTIPIMAFSASATNLQTAPTLKSSVFSNLTNYEGYFYLNAGNYNLYKADGCGSYTNPTVYGGSANTLSQGGSAINVPTSGYYYIKADLVGNTYSVKPYTSFGVIGTATRSGFGTNNFIPMTVVTTNGNLWTVTLDLIPTKKFKFRSALWNGNLNTPSPTPVPGGGPPPFVQNPGFVPSGNLTIIGTYGKTGVSGELGYEDTSDPTASDISAPGTYVNDFTRKSFKLIVDVTNPRAYTYSITPN